MPSLVLGPLLRYVGETDAVLWVETDSPCDVEILGARERTAAVRGLELLARASREVTQARPRRRRA